MKTILLVSILAIIHCDGSVADDNDDKLVSVIVIYRHGDRTPIDPYPTDPYRNESLWPVGFGQLTNLGKEQHYLLGQFLRTRYSTFLPTTYSEDDIHVRSTDVDRTLMSAQANLAGLYPPAGKQIWNENIAWQPIPVHTKPELDDALLAMKKPCARYKHLEEDLLNSDYFNKLRRKNHDLFAYLTRMTGRSINTITQMEYIYNTLSIEAGKNMTLPEWTHNVYPEKMRELAYLSFAIPCYTKPLAKLKIGVLFNEFSKHFSNFQNATYNKKVWMYSGHDTTIANILNALNVFELHSPPYASSILIELHQKNNSQYFVNFLYKNTTNEARLLSLPACNNQVNCPLDKFIATLNQFALTQDEWNMECAVNLFNLYEFTTLQNVIIIASLIMLLMLIVSIVVGIVYARPKNEKSKYLRLPDDDENV